MIVVTGGTGLVGSYLLLKLIKEKSKIRVLIRPGSNPEKVFSVWKNYVTNMKEIFEKIEWYSVDHSNKADLYEALRGAEYIYHCAGKVSFDSRDKQEMWDINVVLSERIIDFCLEYKVKKIAWVSSVAAIGPADGDASRNEDRWPAKTKSMYAKTKTLGEFEVWRGIAEGLNAVIVNPAVIIGPGDWNKSSCRIFSTISGGLKYYTDGGASLVDNQDVATALVKLMKSDISGERFILSGGEMTYKDLFSGIAEIFCVPPPLI